MNFFRSHHGQLLLAAALGLIGGFAYSVTETPPFWALQFLGICELIGTLFVSLLKMVLIPLLFTSLSSGIANLQSHSSISRVWKLSVSYFLLTSAIAILLGLFAVNLFQPGMGIDADVLQEMSGDLETKSLSLGEFLKTLLISLFVNPFSALSHGMVLPTVVFSLFFGAAMVAAGERGKTLQKIMQEGFEIILIIVHWVMVVAPIGIFALLLNLIATQDLQLLTQLTLFVAVVVATTLIHGGIVLPGILKLVTGIGPFKFFKAMDEALITAFSTSSSSATLPITLECVEEKLKVDKSIAGFVLPLGATMNMDGSALYESIAAIFIANIVGLDLNLGQQVVIFFMTMVAAIGAPGIPSAGMITMVMVLEAVGLPAAGIAILLPMDRLLDTIRTTVNVEGDAVGACVVHRLVHGKFDLD